MVNLGKVPTCYIAIGGGRYTVKSIISALKRNISVLILQARVLIGMKSIFKQSIPVLILVYFYVLGYRHCCG